METKSHILPYVNQELIHPCSVSISYSTLYEFQVFPLRVFYSNGQIFY